MNIYQCKNCGKTAKSESTSSIPNDTKCKMATHSWQLLGEAGSKKYECTICGKTVMTKNTPGIYGRCRVDGSISRPHTWKFIEEKKVAAKSVTPSVSKTSTNKVRETKKTTSDSSFLSKLGIVGLVIRIIIWPFKIAFKIIGFFLK